MELRPPRNGDGSIAMTHPCMVNLMNCVMGISTTGTGPRGPRVSLVQLRVMDSLVQVPPVLALLIGGTSNAKLSLFRSTIDKSSHV